MAGDWIHIQKGLSKKPEVLTIARALGRTRHEVAGFLLDIWDWFDSETEDGTTSASADDIASATGVPIAIFSAMKRENWLKEKRGKLVVPKFERWMGSSAKTRLANTLRKQKERSKTSHEKRDRKRTKPRPEKRRDERREESLDGGVDGHSHEQAGASPPPPEREVLERLNVEWGFGTTKALWLVEQGLTAAELDRWTEWQHRTGKPTRLVVHLVKTHVTVAAMERAEGKQGTDDVPEWVTRGCREEGA